MKQLFSERMGYVKPSDIVIRESMPCEVMNAVSSTINLLSNDLEKADYDIYGDIQTVHTMICFLPRKDRRIIFCSCAEQASIQRFGNQSADEISLLTEDEKMNINL